MKRISLTVLLTVMLSLFIIGDAARDKLIDDCQPILKEARDLFVKKDIDGAITKIKVAIKIVPDYHNFHNILSHFYLQKKDYKNQYFSLAKTVKLYEMAKKRGEKRNMTDIYYMNFAAAAVNYSYTLRIEKKYKEEIKLLNIGLKNFTLTMKLAKSGKYYESAKKQAKIIEEELLPRAKKNLNKIGK